MVNIGKFYSWEIVSDTVAIKTIDHSALTYNESGIPTEIRGFFEIEDFDIRDSTEVKLIYKMISYDAIICRNKSGRTAIRWDKELTRYFANISNAKIEFLKLNNTNYRIEIIL